MKKGIPVEKNKEYVVDIIDQGYEGEGIAKIQDYTIFIPGAICKEKVKVRIVKVNSTHAFGKLMEVLQKSDSRIEPDCDTYVRCGGCNLRHMSYEHTLVLKREIVQNLVDKSLQNRLEVEKVIGMEQPYEYRNKAQYPVGYDKNHELVMGVYANRTHEIIPIQYCFIQDVMSQQIAKAIVEFMKENGIHAYDEKLRQGIVRNITIKVAKKTKEIMCVIVTYTKELPKVKELVNMLITKFSNITTIVQNINCENTNVILGRENRILYGTGTIQDKLGDYYFEISPLSFYQINPIQTERLYQTARELANLKKEDVILDLYCGIGTIGIFVSSYVKQVYGIEIVEEAIENAKKNVKRNQVQNIEFFCGDVEKVLENILKEKCLFPDVVFVDPPRRGLDNKTIDTIKKVLPGKVIYISCNPATLVRDLKQLEDQYEVQKIQPVDMFPFTNHVEVVSVLGLKEEKKPKNQ